MGVERHPGQKLDRRQVDVFECLLEVVRKNGEDQARHQSGGSVLDELQGQQIGSEAGEGDPQQDREVVSRNGTQPGVDGKSYDLVE